MAISVNPMTHVIYVPQADLTPLGGVVYELDVDGFRLSMKDWEDNQDYAITMLKTHNHNTEVSLSGITYARIVEFLAPYTIEFQEGQYIVSCIGANHNIADVKVPNQVSLLINNAAGLISNAAIEYASFDGGVTVDVVNGVAGTIGSTGNPIGTPKNPSNNTTDALQIAQNRGFNTFYVIGDITLNDGTDFEEMIFIGESKVKSLITINSNADVENCEFYNAEITGTLDGGNVLQECLIGNINYVNGYIERCVLKTGTITLGGSAVAHFLDCWSGVVGSGTPIIDMGGSGQGLGLRNYNGGIKIINKSGSEKISVDLNSGRVTLDSTVTNGEIIIRGIGQLTDNSVGAAVDSDELLGNEYIANSVWEHADAEFMLDIIRNKKVIEKDGSVWKLRIYDDAGTSPILDKALKDSSGNDITDLDAGVLAQELANSV